MEFEKVMKWHHPIFRFLGCFILVYAVLLYPWPGWKNVYSSYFRELGQIAFGREGAMSVVRFEPYFEQHGFSTLDARMILANSSQTDSNGHGPVKMLDLDTRSIGWTPTVLTMALILATPIPWRRRAWALVWGFFWVNVFILFSLQSWIWDASPGLALFECSPFWQATLDNLEYTLLTQIGTSFSVPVLIWMLVCFRREDLELIISAEAVRKKKV